MKSRLILLFVVTSLATVESYAQQEDGVEFTNSREIDDKRYEDIKASPFYFKNFVKGNIISTELETIEANELNYNGYTGEIEVRNGGEYIILDKDYYVRIEIFPHQNPKLKLNHPLIFQREFEKDGSRKFQIMIHEGSKVKFVKDFDVTILEREINNVGKTIIQKRFFSSESYYFILDGKPREIKLRKKRILSELNNKKELEEFISNNKINIETEAGLKKLLEHYETL